MKLGNFKKQPVEVKDYDIDYGPWLAPPGDTLDTIQTEVHLLSGPDAPPLVVDNVELTLDTAKLWVSGGADGGKYKVEVTTTTVGGRVDQSELVFDVKDI